FMCTALRFVLLLARFFLPSYGHLRSLHSFPTRRSSDLSLASAKDLAPTTASVVFCYFPGIFMLRAKHNNSTRHYTVNGRYQCRRDRKSTRLNSSHGSISYAVFCLKKKKTTQYNSKTTTY